MAKRRSGLLIVSALAIVLSLTVSTQTHAREQDRSCTDHKARSDDKPDKPDKPEKEKKEKVEIRGHMDPDGTVERIVIDPPNRSEEHTSELQSRFGISY